MAKAVEGMIYRGMVNGARMEVTSIQKDKYYNTESVIIKDLEKGGVIECGLAAFEHCLLETMDGGEIMTTEKPLFLQNSEWYYFDEAEWKYKLTEKATTEAVKSYEDFYKALGKQGG